MLRLASIAVFQVQYISCSEGEGESCWKLLFFSSGQMIQKVLPSFNAPSRLSGWGKALEVTNSLFHSMHVCKNVFWTTSKTGVLKPEQGKFWGLFVVVWRHKKKEKYFVEEW